MNRIEKKAQIKSQLQPLSLNTKNMNRSKDIIVEVEFHHDIQKVWQAITHLNQMRQWFFENIPDFQAETGFKTDFPVQSGDRVFHHLWKITEVIPNKKIVYDWSYKSLPGKGMVSFELFESNEGTLLKLTNKGLDSFPDDLPEFTRESCLAGWNYFLKERLKSYLS